MSWHEIDSINSQFSQGYAWNLFLSKRIFSQVDKRHFLGQVASGAGLQWWFAPIKDKSRRLLHSMLASHAVAMPVRVDGVNGRHGAAASHCGSAAGKYM